MSSNIQCHLYTKTVTKDDIVRMHTFFQKVKLYIQESHLFGYVHKCDECGQLYFFRNLRKKLIGMKEMTHNIILIFQLPL